MGLGGISIWQLLIILLIVILIFGTRRFKKVGGDLGQAIKNFRQQVKEEESSIIKEEHSTIKEEPSTEKKVHAADNVLQNTTQKNVNPKDNKH